MSPFRESTRDEWRHFCYVTSFHGFAEMAKSSALGSRIWAIILVTMVVATGYQVSFVVDSHYSQPYVTVTEPQQRAAMQIPAITVCLRSAQSPRKMRALLRRLPRLVLRATTQRLGVPDYVMSSMMKFYTDDSIWSFGPSAYWKEVPEQRLEQVYDRLSQHNLVSYLYEWCLVHMLALPSFDAVALAINNSTVEDMSKFCQWHDGWITNYLHPELAADKIDKRQGWSRPHYLWLGFLAELGQLYTRRTNLTEECYWRVMQEPLSSLDAASLLDDMQRCSLTLTQRLHYFTLVSHFKYEQFWEEKTIQEHLAYELPEVFENCFFGLDQIDCAANGKLYYTTFKGICYTLQSAKNQTIAKAGLQVLVNTRSQDAPERVALMRRQEHVMSDGIDMYLGEDEQVAYYAPSNSIAHVQLTRIDYDRTVMKSRSMCREHMATSGTMGLFARPNATYTATACRSMCTLMASLSHCGCIRHVDIHMLHSRFGYSVCHDEKCVTGLLFNTETENPYLTCIKENCQEACRETQTEAQITYHRYPSAQHLQYLARAFSHAAHVYTKQHIQLVRDSLRADGLHNLSAVLADPDWFHVFHDKATEMSYTPEADVDGGWPSRVCSADQSHCLSLLQLVGQHTNMQLRVTANARREGSRLHTLQQMKFSQLMSGRVFSEHRRAFTVNSAVLNANPVQLMENELGNTRFASADADFVYNPALHAVDYEYELDVNSKYNFEMRQELNPSTGWSSYTQQCSGQGCSSACHAYGRELVQRWADSHVHLQIYFPKFQTLMIRTEERSTFDELLGAIGGTLGFFMGGSLISMIHLVVSVCNYLCRQPAQPPDKYAVSPTANGGKRHSKAHQANNIRHMMQTGMLMDSNNVHKKMSRAMVANSFLVPPPVPQKSTSHLKRANMRIDNKVHRKVSHAVVNKSTAQPLQQRNSKMKQLMRANTQHHALRNITENNNLPSKMSPHNAFSRTSPFNQTTEPPKPNNTVSSTLKRVVSPIFQSCDASVEQQAENGAVAQANNQQTCPTDV